MSEDNKTANSKKIEKTKKLSTALRDNLKRRKAVKKEKEKAE